VDLARQVLAGNTGLGPGLYYVSPLYIYFLAGALWLIGSFTAVRFLQIALGTAAIGLQFLTTRAWFGERAAWIAAILAGLTGLFTFYEILILQASIDAFLTSAALWCVTAGLRAQGPGPKVQVTWLTTAGVIFGIQTLNRPNVLIAVAGMALVLLALKRIKPATLLIAGLLAGMAPAALRNVVVSHQWTFVSSHGGLNFYIGNGEGATGFYHVVPGIRPTIAGQEEDVRRVAERATGRTLSDTEVSDYFFNRTWSWMRDHPGTSLALFGRKLAYVFVARHVALPHSYPFYAYDERTLLRFLFVGPWLLVPLGLTGLLFAVPSDRRADLLVWVSFVPAYAIAVAVFFIAERYRLPLLVPLCVGAGAAIDLALRAGSGLRAQGSGHGQDRAPAAIPRRGSTRGPASERSETSRARGGGAPRAEREANPSRGISVSSRRGCPPSPSLWRGLAVARRRSSRAEAEGPAASEESTRRNVVIVLTFLALFVFANWPYKLQDGRWEEGLRLAQRLVILQRFDEADRWVDRLEPTAPRPGATHYGVGMQLLQQGESQRALAHLSIAERLAPGDPHIEYALGQALLKTGRAREAVPHLRIGFDAGIELPEGGLDYALALADAGDPHGALRAAQRITPSDTEPGAWLKLGRLAMQAQAPGEAERFFRHAVSLRPDNAAARVQYGLNLLVLRRFEEAARELTESVKLDPGNADALSRLAYCELQLGRRDDARVHARAALALAPDDPFTRQLVAAIR
jgi:Flp pilus assembly protein TadD